MPIFAALWPIVWRVCARDHPWDDHFKAVRQLCKGVGASLNAMSSRLGLEDNRHVLSF